MFTISGSPQHHLVSNPPKIAVKVETLHNLHQYKLDAF